jgi:hypothetical protein
MGNADLFACRRYHSRAFNDLESAQEKAKMKVYMISHEEMETLHSLRVWLSNIIKTEKLAKSQQHSAADFAIDLSELLEGAMCAEITPNDT